MPLTGTNSPWTKCKPRLRLNQNQPLQRIKPCTKPGLNPFLWVLVPGLQPLTGRCGRCTQSVTDTAATSARQLSHFQPNPAAKKWEGTGTLPRLCDAAFRFPRQTKRGTVPALSEEVRGVEFLSPHLLNDRLCV